VSTGAQPLPHRMHWPHRRVLWLIVGLAVLAGIAVGVDRAFFWGGGQPSRPALQQILDGLVSGPQRAAPGATAYVVGPQVSWVGSAGIANVKTGEVMPPNGRMRIQSLSKTWLMAVILQLANEGKLNLDDTVARWFPGLLPYGDRITIRELMTDTSGLIDDNTMETAFPSYLARVKDAKLRAQLAALAARVRANPATPLAPIWLIRMAAWQPLLSVPGSEYHHSNIGWNIAGMIAAKAGGKPLPVLYRERIYQPLGITHTSYQPQGPIAGPHTEGYYIGKNGNLTDATAFTYGKGADGAIVTDAADEAAFTKALLDNKLGIRQQVLGFYGANGSNGPGCPGDAFRGTGLGAASRTYVYYDHTGSHIAVLLLNGRRAALGTNDPKAAAAALQLYCSA